IKTWIVNFYQWPLRDSLTQIEAQRLKNFEPARARLLRSNNLISLKFAILRLTRALPPRFCEGYKPFRIGLLILSNRFLQSLADPAGQVNHHADVLPVHQW